MTVKLGITVKEMDRNFFTDLFDVKCVSTSNSYTYISNSCIYIYIFINPLHLNIKKSRWAQHWAHINLYHTLYSTYNCLNMTQVRVYSFYKELLTFYYYNPNSE